MGQRGSKKSEKRPSLFLIKNELKINRNYEEKTVKSKDLDIFTNLYHYYPI